MDIVKELVKAGADENAKDQNGDPVLVAANEVEDIDIVKRLVTAEEADGNAKEQHADPILVSAVRTEDIDTVKKLVKAGADVNAKDRNADPILASAVRTENIDMVKTLLKAGADANARDRNKNPILRSAVRSRNIHMVKELVKAGADVNAKDRDGYPVLVLAEENKDIHIVKELVKAGGDGNARDWSGHLILVSAVKNRNIDMVKELVKAGADVNAKDEHGTLVLESAVVAGNIDIVKELVKAGANVNALDLASAVRTGNIDIIKELVKAGADVNAKDWFGYPVLVSAMSSQDIDMINELVEAGADVNAEFDNGYPVLLWAMGTNNIDIVKVLVKAGVDVNVIIKNKNYRSNIRPLHIAVAWADQVECLQELVNSGAHISYDDQGDVSALHLVTAEADTDILRTVYDDKKHCNARGKYNRTFLHYTASLESHQQIKDVLSLSDISVDLKDDFGNSPLHCAVQIGNLETITALIDAGCDIEAVDSSGRTLLHLAAIYGHSDLIDLFIDIYRLNPLKPDNMQRNCLHYAVIFRHEHFVSALLQKNFVHTLPLRDVDSLKEYNTKDSNGKTPSDYLLLCEKDHLISKYLQGKSVGIETVLLKSSISYSPGNSNALSIDISKISKEPSIGSVATITGHDHTMFVKYVKHVVEELIQKAVPAVRHRVCQVVGCGSSFEGTMTGMPDELNFLVKLDSRFESSEHEGYKKRYSDPVTGSYDLWLWDTFMSFWSDCQTKGEASQYSDGHRSMKMPLPPQRHPDRKTCTTWIWLYSDEVFTDLPVMIDFALALEVSLEDAETRIRSTWMMTEEKMKEKKCYIVPKILNEKSEVTEKFRSRFKFKSWLLHPKDQQGRESYSYPTLEVEHIQALEDRVKDVYITAKCMRNVEVCGFRAENDEGDIKSVSELVTSYILKSVFLHLVKLFLKSDMSLGKMVLMVYEQLEKCLERGHLPMFFDPEMNVLAGSKLSTEESLQVTRIMTRFARSLYERDVSPEERERDAAEEERVLEEERVAYDERRREYEKEWRELIARDYWIWYSSPRDVPRKLLAPFLPIYLRQPSSNTEQD